MFFSDLCSVYTQKNFKKNLEALDYIHLSYFLSLYLLEGDIFLNTIEICTLNRLHEVYRKTENESEVLELK